MPTNTNVSVGDPELGQFSAPSLIIQRGIDEDANANPYIVHTPEPGPAVWKIVAVLVVMLLLGGAIVSYLLFNHVPLDDGRSGPEPTQSAPQQ